MRNANMTSPFLQRTWRESSIPLPPPVAIPRRQGPVASERPLCPQNFEPFITLSLETSAKCTKDVCGKPPSPNHSQAQRQCVQEGEPGPEPESLGSNPTSATFCLFILRRVTVLIGTQFFCLYNGDHISLCIALRAVSGT